MTRYRNRTPDDIGRDWRQSIIRFAGLDPDGKPVPMSPRPRPQDIRDIPAMKQIAANDRNAALHRAIRWTWL